MCLVISNPWNRNAALRFRFHRCISVEFSVRLSQHPFLICISLSNSFAVGRRGGDGTGEGDICNHYQQINKYTPAGWGSAVGMNRHLSQLEPRDGDGWILIANFSSPVVAMFARWFQSWVSSFEPSNHPFFFQKIIYLFIESIRNARLSFAEGRRRGKIHLLNEFSIISAIKMHQTGIIFVVVVAAAAAVVVVEEKWINDSLPPIVSRIQCQVDSKQISTTNVFLFCFQRRCCRK